MDLVLDDGSGYVVNDDDLEFLRISKEQVAGMWEYQTPLAMSLEVYKDFRDGLLGALERDGVTDADIRLQGSSAHFWSSWHKSVPRTVDDVRAEIAKDREVREDEVAVSLGHLDRQWPLPDRPVRRPFDSMFVTGIHREPSDYDLQICSDQMMELARREFDDSQHRSVPFINPKFGFVEKTYAEKPFMFLANWLVFARSALNRDVTWALFDNRGPAKNVEQEHLSSHHKDSDWKIAVLAEGQALPAVPGVR